ncbi:hypothetical protein MSAN_02202800 [Mycena sanguinolenta]|uniref:Uncharacterized protein n=1 Tax=Mycena sanguinolenta TaxID=230812 RepID=A0A8H7CKL3_9AGAR|nr:hypothetical protein MSAN_02202800 [Mycena sanguinolenta]
MARTKQTARKSNGGSAPKYDLAAAEAAAQAQVVVPAPPTKRQKIAWCSGCEDGGTLIKCSLCPRYFCTECLEFPTEVDDELVFYCPKCWVSGAKEIPAWKKAVIPKQTALAPYQGFWKHGRPLGVVRYLGNQSLRGQWPIIDTARTVIISIHLEGVDIVGDASHVVHSHLRPYYSESPQQLKLCELVFNLHDTKKRNAFHRKIQGVVADLEEFKPETVLIFVTTHSTPDTGDLWIEPKGLAASPVHQVLPILIPSRLQAVIKAASGSMLIFLSCGGLNRSDAREEVSAFVKTAKIQYAIGFTVEHFLPAAANTFLQDTVHAFFIARYGKSFARILASHCELGIHTDILMYFEDGDVFRYSWHHSGRHPFGQSVPHQCPKCFVVSSLRVSLDEESRVVLRCPVKTCDYVKTIDKAVQQIRVEEEPWKKKDTSVRGAWYGDWVSFKNGRGFKAPTFGDKEVAA